MHASRARAFHLVFFLLDKSKKSFGHKILIPCFFNSFNLIHIKSLPTPCFRNFRLVYLLHINIGSLLKSTKLLNLFATQTSDLSLAFRLKTFFNTYVREGETLANTKAIVAKFKIYYANVIDDIIDSKKMRATKEKYAQIRDKGLSDLEKYDTDIYFAVATYLSLITAKNILVSKLNGVGQIGTFFQTDDGYQVTSPEGYVAVDRIGNAVKLVDRLTFSRRNFTAAKSWK